MRWWGMHRARGATEQSRRVPGADADSRGIRDRTSKDYAYPSALMQFRLFREEMGHASEVLARL